MRFQINQGENHMLDISLNRQCSGAQSQIAKWD